MNKFSRLIFFIFIVLTMGSQSVFCEESKTYINQFQNAFGKQMEKEFNLTFIEGGFFHNFSVHNVEFYAYRRATLEEARALELSVLSRLVQEINKNPKLLSYLNTLSLAPESIGASIRFVDLRNRSYNDGSIDRVSSNYANNDKRYLHYTTTDPFRESLDDSHETFGPHFDESFEDAVELNATMPNINPAIHELTGYEEELLQIFTSFKREMKKEYDLFFDTSGWMVTGKSSPDLSEVRTKCTYFYPVDSQEARALILLASEKLLTALNSSEKLKPYLKEYPFSADRLKLRMLFRKNKFFVGKVPYDDGLESAALNENTITYYHDVPSTTSFMSNRVIAAKESYQEARKIFENTSPSTLSKKITKKTNHFVLNLSEYITLIFVMVVVLVISPFGWLLMFPLLGFFLVSLWRRRSRKAKNKSL